MSMLSRCLLPLALLLSLPVLAAKPYISALRIEGHSDTDGADSQPLTEKRALAVARWLVEREEVISADPAPDPRGSSSGTRPPRGSGIAP
jgi:hypothetical protein